MSSSFIKRLLTGVLIVLGVFIILMITPGITGILFPGKPPVGYHFETLAYVAAGIGLERVVDLKPEVPSVVKELKNVEYKMVDGKTLQMDFYKPKNAEGQLPLLVFIHGGSWKGGKRSDYLVYLIKFAQKGYMTATVSYRLSGDSIYPAAVEDVNDAVAWLFEHGEDYGYDPDRIALVGGSAGAHLALLSAYGWNRKGVLQDKGAQSDAAHRIKAVVDIYGPVVLTTPYARSQPLVVKFLGQTYDDNPDLYKEASPLSWLTRQAPPTLILHGTSDNLVPVSQSDLLKHKLDSAGVPSEYYRFPLWPHAMDVAGRVNDYATIRMEEFFEKHLR